MVTSLIWAAVVFIPLMILTAAVVPPLRRGLARWADSFTVDAAERQAGVERVLAETGERRHRLAIAQATIADETGKERARLAAETAQYETDRQAADKTLDAAVQARRQVIAARADAEAALAPEAARGALGGQEWLAEAYAAYCQEYRYAEPLPFGQWIQGFDGAPRG